MIFRNRGNVGVVSPSAFLSKEQIPESLAFESLFEGSDTILYTAMMESMSAIYHGTCAQDKRIVMEGFKDMARTAYEFFKNIVKKVLNFVKNSFDLLDSYIRDFDKFIESHESNASKFKPFEVQGFTYTISSSPVDNCGITRIVEGYNNHTNKIKEMSLGDVQDLIAKDCNRDVMSGLRAKISGVSGMIKEDRFEESLFKQYRNGKKTKETIKVDSSTLNGMIADYRKFKSLVKEVKADGHAVESLFNELADFFKEMPQYEYDSSSTRKINNYNIKTDIKGGSASPEKTGSEEYSGDLYKKMGAWYNHCFKMSKDISYIYSKAYNAKISAMKEALGFYRGNIRRALSPFADKEKGAES